MCCIQTQRVIVISATFKSFSVTIYISRPIILQDTTLCYIEAKTGAPELIPGFWWGPSCCIYKKHGECLIRSRKCLPFRSFRVHTRVLVETVLLTFLVFCVKANIRYIENEVIDLIINPIRKRKSNSSILYNGMWLRFCIHIAPIKTLSNTILAKSKYW
jgi:hypothetical protein